MGAEDKLTTKIDAKNSFWNWTADELYMGNIEEEEEEEEDGENSELANF